MRGVVLHGPGDIRVEERADPVLQEDTDAIIRVTSTCVCGSDLWGYRGRDPQAEPSPMGHEYLGVVEEVGSAVREIAVRDRVVGSVVASDNTCQICRAGYQSRCRHQVFMAGIGTQAEYARIPLADGTLVRIPAAPTAQQERSLLAASDVLGTGWFGSTTAQAGPGKSVAVVGDGAVGLMAVLAARYAGAEHVIAMSGHADRQVLAEHFGATEIVTERGEAAAERVRDLTGGYGAHSTVEAVGTQESMQQAVAGARPGGHVGFLGVSHDVEVSGADLFFATVHLHGGPAPVRRFLPELVDLIMTGRIDPSPVFDHTLPLQEAAEAYRAMDERRAIKVMLTI